MDRYRHLGTIARPRINISEKMEVRFGLRLVQLHVDEKLNQIELGVWCRYVSFVTLCNILDIRETIHIYLL